MGVQVSIAASCIDKQRLGYQAVSLTHFDDTAEPSIAAGSKVEIGGALYEFLADEAGTGWGGIGASNTVYILLTPAGASVSWSYTTTAPTWDTAKQGFYTAGNRVIGGLCKSAGSTYLTKWLYNEHDPTGNVHITVDIGDWNMDFSASKDVTLGVAYSKIMGISGMIRNDTDGLRYPISPSYSSSAEMPVVIAGMDANSNTRAILQRWPAGAFDNADFDSTAYNRGWITVICKP